MFQLLSDFQNRRQPWGDFGRVDVLHSVISPTSDHGVSKLINLSAQGSKINLFKGILKKTVGFVCFCCGGRRFQTDGARPANSEQTGPGQTDRRIVTWLVTPKDTNLTQRADCQLSAVGRTCRREHGDDECPHNR